MSVKETCNESGGVAEVFACIENHEVLEKVLTHLKTHPSGGKCQGYGRQQIGSIYCSWRSLERIKEP